MENNILFLHLTGQCNSHCLVCNTKELVELERKMGHKLDMEFDDHNEITPEDLRDQKQVDFLREIIHEQRLYLRRKEWDKRDLTSRCGLDLPPSYQRDPDEYYD
jgi:hypothetical protein